jgi:cell division protein FtsB
MASAAQIAPDSRRTARVRTTKPAMRRRISRPVRHLALAGSIVVVGGLVGLLPFATGNAQQENQIRASERLGQLTAENERLTKRRAELQTDEEVARIAREEFGLTPQGAEVYSIPDLRPQGQARERLPEPTVTVPAPPSRSRLDRVIDAIVFWD